MNTIPYAGQHNVSQYLPSAERLQQRDQNVTQKANAANEYILAVLSGQTPGRVNADVVNNLIGKLSNENFRDNVFGEMENRGMQFDPNWIQNHIQPANGTVRPDQYGQIQQYALTMGQQHPEAYGLMDQYQMGGGVPSAQRERIDNFLIDQRMGVLGNQEWNPQTQQWGLPQAQQMEDFKAGMNAFNMDTMQNPFYNSLKTNLTSFGIGGDGMQVGPTNAAAANLPNQGQTNNVLQGVTADTPLDQLTPEQISALTGPQTSPTQGRAANAIDTYLGARPGVIDPAQTQNLYQYATAHGIHDRNGFVKQIQEVQQAADFGVIDANQAAELLALVGLTPEKAEELMPGFWDKFLNFQGIPMRGYENAPWYLQGLPQWVGGLANQIRR